MLASVCTMGDAEDLILLREDYQRALASYEGISAVLNRHFLHRSRASPAELQSEREARAVLADARRAYLKAWKRGSEGATAASPSD